MSQPLYPGSQRITGTSMGRKNTSLTDSGRSKGSTGEKEERKEMKEDKKEKKKGRGHGNKEN